MDNLLEKLFEAEDKDAYKMTRDEFISTYRDAFRMYKGQRTPRFLQLTKHSMIGVKKYFKNGKPIKNIEKILGEIYDERIKPHIGKPSFMDRLKKDMEDLAKSYNKES